MESADKLLVTTQELLVEYKKSNAKRDEFSAKAHASKEYAQGLELYMRLTTILANGDLPEAQRDVLVQQLNRIAASFNFAT